MQGGGGSGVVYSAYSRSLLTGLQEKESESKILLFQKLSDFYQKAVDSAYEAQMKANGTDRPVPGLIAEPELPDELLNEACEFTETAVLCYSRYSSEGSDRTGTPGDGDFYLSPEEQAMTEKVLNAFPKCVVVLNVGGVVDTSWIRDDLNVKGCLLMGQAGMEGGLAAADLRRVHRRNPHPRSDPERGRHADGDRPRVLRGAGTGSERAERRNEGIRAE